MPTADRLAYAAGHAVRFGWFYAQYRRALRAVAPAVRREDVPEGMPSTSELLGRLFALFRRDLANIEAGPYAMPPEDRKSVREGKSVSVRVDLGGRRIIKKTNKDKKQILT